jgi:hypothetical protein
MLHTLKSKQTDKSLNDECLCKCYMHWNRNKQIRAWMMNVYVNVTCTEIETNQNKRAWMNVFVNVICTEIETKEKGLNECLCKCYIHWNQNKQKRARMNVYVNVPDDVACTKIKTNRKELESIFM